MHVDSDTAAVAVLYVPCRHSVHATDPFTSLNLPTPLASHVPPSGPVYPFWQEQLVIFVLPSSECV